jgi:hypothetical protein
MNEHKIGDKIILKKKCRVLEIRKELMSMIDTCAVCYYCGRKKCMNMPCRGKVYIDITMTLSENDKLLLERGLLIDVK